ncbi:DUF1629 domain-containing protein [Paenibacillus filicis]|uniref:DUF1629 domain-containing protein n=1 Tax=Paenibacillus filicis TaxID=669464 RepID=A0ABU9DN34_9BACL
MVWELESNTEGFQTFQLVEFEESSIVFAEMFNGVELISDHKWNPVYVEVADEGMESDYPHFWGSSGVPIVSENAKIILEDVLGNEVEFLPIMLGEKIYYAIHIIKHLDAVDRTKTEFRQLPSGLIVGFKKLHFIQNVIENHNIFKVYLNNNLYGTSIFVSDVLKEIVIKHQLKGFKFKQFS